MSKKVQLVLRSSDISNLGYSGVAPFAPVERAADFTGTTGSINRWQSNMTWNNINLRSMLGNLYKPYGTYNLKLESVCFSLTSNLATFTAAENNRAFNIVISGLPFMTSYSSGGNLQNEGLLAAVRVPSGAQHYLFNYNNNELTFSLQNLNGVNNVNINIQYRDLLLNANEPVGATNTVAFPNVQFVFSIYLVE
jgi:hypothetical protein